MSLLSMSANVEMMAVPERGSDIIEFAVRVGADSNGERVHRCKVKGYAKWDANAKTVQIVAYKKPFDIVTSIESPVTTNSPSSGIEQLVKRDIDLAINEITRMRSELEQTLAKVEWLKRIKRNGVANVFVQPAAEIDVVDVVAYEFVAHFDILRSNGDGVPAIGRFVVFFLEDAENDQSTGHTFEIIAIDDQGVFIKFETPSRCDSVTRIFDQRGDCLQPTLDLYKARMVQETRDMRYFEAFHEFLARCGLW